MKAKNPGYNGKAQLTVEDSKVVEANLTDCNVADISPLAGQPLRNLVLLEAQVKTGWDVVREMKSIETINEMPAAEFWQKFDAGRTEPED